MTFTRVSHRGLLMMGASLLLASQPAFAQDDTSQPDEEEAQNEIVVPGQRIKPQENVSVPSALIVVTGARVRQGGAQDAKHFRSIALDELDEQGLPSASSLTLEGLMGEHDLTLPTTGGCAQLFCVATHAMPSPRDDRMQFVGIGFESGIDADAYRSEPLSLIAVVDRSGSMNGPPIQRVKESLHAALDQMGEGDRMGIVIYGSDTRVHQPVIDVAGNREALRQAIDAIAINGSTYMEAGMKLGFATAFEELPNSRGKTRLMLFTDENPNVGNTSAEGFMGQAIAGSRKGVGMTTIGVGAHFDGALATKVSSVRGGNLFFVPREGSANELFAKEFSNMVSEVAQDLAISIDPADGVKVAGIYGVPGELITDAGDGTVTVTVGSAFLSSNGGGIYATLEGKAANAANPLAEISVAYTDAITQKREYDAEGVMPGKGEPPANLAKAELLVDQYVTMTEALAAYHTDRKPTKSLAMLEALSERVQKSGIEGMQGEVELIDGLKAKASRLADLGTGKTLPFEVFGEWIVKQHKGVKDISRGDFVEINKYGEFITERTKGRVAGDEIYQDFAINENWMRIEDSGLTMRYRVRGNRLYLTNALDGTKIILERDEG